MIAPVSPALFQSCARLTFRKLASETYNAEDVPGTTSDFSDKAVHVNSSNCDGRKSVGYTMTARRRTSFIYQACKSFQSRKLKRYHLIQQP